MGWCVVRSTGTVRHDFNVGEYSYAATAGFVSPYERRKRARRAVIAEWLAGRRLVGWDAPPPEAARAEQPPKTRTEWGMVHRERCVHRMGLN